MTRIITPPDLEQDRSIPKVLVRNCDLSTEQLQEIINQLGTKSLDIYVYNDAMNDIQWFEGLRAMSTKTYDFKESKGKDVFEWFKKIEEAHAI